MRYVVLAAFLMFTACTQPQPADNDEAPDNKEEVKEHRDQWRPREAQSDFLDIGKQAGIEWLSFVPQDQLDYPEYFSGLDRDQKRRLRLAPKGSDEQVLIQFDLPEGSKLWPVDWYGIELMAVDLPNLKGFSVALARAGDPEGVALGVCGRRARSWGGKQIDIGELPRSGPPGPRISRLYTATKDDELTYHYVATPLRGLVSSVQGLAVSMVVVVEWSSKQAEPGAESSAALSACVDILASISIKREIAFEGSPKHKCTSRIDEQLAGTLRFPDGTLKLPVTEEMLVRKIGGDSTIQIDGHGAEPWILIRRLDANEAEGDMRATLRRDTTFNRRLKVTSGKWSTGFVPEGAKLPIVCFDYDDRAAENNLLGILKAGEELLTFEVVTRGVRDGDKRRAARQAAIKLLAGASGDPATDAPELNPLIGWNMGTMGRDD